MDEIDREKCVRITYFPDREHMCFPDEVDFEEMRSAFNVRMEHMNKAKTWDEFFDRCNGKYKEASTQKHTRVGMLMKKILDNKDINLLEKSKSKLQNHQYRYLLEQLNITSSYF